jgi:outer membrane protein OmpA-like peptidoglycan-associated protein/methionine-rich copper-binding protein CopC
MRRNTLSLIIARLWLALLLCSAPLAFTLLSPSPAIAQDIVSFSFSSTVAVKDEAYFELTAIEQLTSLEVTISRPQGKPIKLSKKNHPANSPARVTWREKDGSYNYTLSIEATTASGATINGSQAFSVTFGAASAANPITLQVPKKLADLDGGKLTYSTNIPFERAELTVYTDNDRLVAQTTPPGQSKTKDLTISWTTTADPIRLVELKVFDKHGNWASQKLIPFTVSIPHEDVVFASNSDVIQDAERPKLDDALKVIFDELAKHGSDFEFSLLIGGYTDTVGSKEDNQALSEKRARSIARYFRDKGLKIPIFYKGFGEDNLAIPTADNVDEPRNRRATYNLGDLAPSGTWRALK